MEYYIQGNKEKAEQIKAAFEKKGFKLNRSLQNCGVIDWIYFSLNGEVRAINARNLELFKTHPDYQELELPVELKFKIGDWLVYKYDNCFAGGFREAQVVKVKDGVYYFSTGTTGSCKFIDENCRLWKIEDAKDGDVLVSSENSIFIYNGVCGEDGDTIGAYGGLLSFGFDRASTTDRWTTIYGVEPATKEQRNFIFIKMNEAGYEWDANKKELRKIKPYYDISNFHAGMPVLVREYDTCHWQWVQYSHFNGVGLFFAAGKTWRQCIPFNDDTKHLLGTTDMPSEEYINW